MGDTRAPVDLVLLWHHHQPDYRHPHDGRAALPWVRLHATKDYLDMARHLERHPGLRVTFNFVPSLVDQIEDAVAGGADELFDALAKPLAGLSAEERRHLAARCMQAPAHAFERWPAYRRLRDRFSAGGATNGDNDRDLLALEIWFLLAWIDPLFHSEADIVAVLARAEEWSEADRVRLLAVHRRLTAEVIPAYRELATRGQIELSASPYYHPILPLLVDLASARRARPALPLPIEKFQVPADARWHIEHGMERHEEVFGARPLGMWPSEGSVSPETATLAAAAGVRWLASDEGVLWASLPEPSRRRAMLYRPWRFATEGGEVALLFRDHELSDRIGFVYQRWKPADAAADFVERLRRIGREFAGDTPPVVSVILDGENCWEYYADDGTPFLAALYQALADAPDVRTRTPSDLLSEGRSFDRLDTLASGSWIDADFHIWIGHAEKNRAWDLLSRARHALVASGATADDAAESWRALHRAEGSDWFWWFGDDHHTDDRAIFDRLFREQLRAVYEGARIGVPAALALPIVRPAVAAGSQTAPIGFVHPVIDGRHTTFYEWQAAGRFQLGAGGAMHRGSGPVRELHYGFDLERLYLRIDFDQDAPPGDRFGLAIEIVEPTSASLRVNGLAAGAPPVRWGAGPHEGQSVPGAVCRIGGVLELAIPFASLDLGAGDMVVLVLNVMDEGGAIASVPDEAGFSFAVPGPGFEAAMWSA